VLKRMYGDENWRVKGKVANPRSPGQVAVKLMSVYYYAPASVGSGHYETMADVCPSVCHMPLAAANGSMWTAGNSRDTG